MSNWLVVGFVILLGIIYLVTCITALILIWNWIIDELKEHKNKEE